MIQIDARGDLDAALLRRTTLCTVLAGCAVRTARLRRIRSGICCGRCITGRISRGICTTLGGLCTLIIRLNNYTLLIFTAFVNRRSVSQDTINGLKIFI